MTQAKQPMSLLLDYYFILLCLYPVHYSTLYLDLIRSKHDREDIAQQIASRFNQVLALDVALRIPGQQVVRAKSVADNEYTVAHVMAVYCGCDDADCKEGDRHVMPSRRARTRLHCG